MRSCMQMHTRAGQVCMMGVMCFWGGRCLGTCTHVDLCGLYELRQGLGVLCTPQCRITPAGTPSFLFCQVSVAPLCFPAMVSNRPQTLDRTAKCPGCREGKLRCSERDQPPRVCGTTKHAACKAEVVAALFRI